MFNEYKCLMAIQNIFFSQRKAAVHSFQQEKPKDKERRPFFMKLKKVSK